MTRRTDIAAALAALLLVASCERGDGTDRAAAHDDPGATIADTSDRASQPMPAAPATDRGASAPARSSAIAEDLRVALDRLVRGATTDSATWFSAQTAGILRGIEVDANGRAVVDFVDLRGVIPNASSSAGSRMLLDQLNATVFSVEGVTAVEYRMAGSCELLGEWLQYGTCLRFDRE